MIGGKAPTVAIEAGCLAHRATSSGVETAGLTKGFSEVGTSTSMG